MRLNFKGLIFCAVLTIIAYGKISPQNVVNDLADTSGIFNFLEKARKFNVKNELDSSIHYDKILVDIYLARRDTNNAVKMINFIAKLFQKKFEFDSALAYIKKGLKFFPQSSMPSEKGELYNTLGTLYYSLGDYANALIYFKHSLNIRVQYNSPTEKIIGDSYTNLGNTQFDLGHYDDAIYYYKKALEQRLLQKKVNMVMVAKNYNNIGYTYLQKDNIIEAKRHFIKGFACAPLAVLYQNIGAIAMLEKKFLTADTSLKKSLEIRQTHLGVKHFLTAQSYNALAELQKVQRKYDKALEYFTEGLNSSIKSNEGNFFGSPDVKLYDIISVKEFFVSLNGKAEMLLELAKKDSTINSLLYAKQLLAFCIPLLSNIQKHYEIDDSKLKLREFSDKTMNLGIEICYELYKLTNDKKYAAEAFLFSETKRSSVLNESKMKRAAMLELDVPDSIKYSELTLKLKLNSLFISSEENQVNEKDNKTSTRENLIISTVNDYDSLLSNIKQNYPKYASLVSAENILQLEELKTKISNQEILVEYTITQENIFIFCITHESTYFIKKDKNSLFDKWNYEYRNSIKKIDRSVYYNSAKALYKELIIPIEKELLKKRKLTIIPCSELASLPFDALISQKGIPLLQLSAIQYCSSSHYFGEDSMAAQIKYPYYFIGIAPSYNNLNDFAPLKNEEEIIEISKVITNCKYQDSLIIGGNASKEKFFSIIGRSQILHIAAHSYADLMNEGLSGIVFGSDQNDGKENILTGSEIIASEITNDLVVLSSCEGGHGKKANGEGVLSLARNFIKAGANNLLVALWKVPDKQTKIFMTEFYKQLIKDNNYVDALSRTKRAIIKESKQYAFPNTWAAFVLMK